MNVVAINGAVLNDTDQSMIVAPRQADQATAGVLPNDVGERNAGGVEEAELSQCGLGVELDDLGIVADESDRTAEWRAGDFVAAEIDVPPLHRVVEFRFPVVTVAEKLPLGGHRHVGHRK